MSFELFLTMEGRVRFLNSVKLQYLVIGLEKALTSRLASARHRLVFFPPPEKIQLVPRPRRCAQRGETEDDLFRSPPFQGAVCPVASRVGTNLRGAAKREVFRSTKSSVRNSESRKKVSFAACCHLYALSLEAWPFHSQVIRMSINAVQATYRLMSTEKSSRKQSFTFSCPSTRRKAAERKVSLSLSVKHDIQAA